MCILLEQFIKYRIQKNFYLFIFKHNIVLKPWKLNAAFSFSVYIQSQFQLQCMHTSAECDEKKGRDTEKKTKSSLFTYRPPHNKVHHITDNIRQRGR